MQQLKWAKKLFLLTFTIALGLFLCFQPVLQMVSAEPISDAELKALDQYPHWVGSACGSSGDEETAPSTEAGGVFMLGDSITVGAKQYIESEFSKDDVRVKVDASTSRSLSGKGTDGTKLSGLDALKDDANTEDIKAASIVVIALGTNSEASVDSYKSKVKEAVKQVKNTKDSLKVYWVNIFSKVPQQDSYNNALKSLAKDNDFTIIDTTDASISLGGDDIHPTLSGSQKFAKTIAQAVEYGGSSSSSSSDDGSSSGTETIKPVEYDAGMAIDTDGIGGNPHGDPNHQGQTSYANGKLSAYQTNYFVLAPGWASAHGLVLGDIAKVTYKGKSVFAVYGDNYKGDQVHGEGSYKLAKELDILQPPVYSKAQNSGVHYAVYPGTNKQLSGSVDQDKIDEIGAKAAGTSATETSDASQISSCCSAPVADEASDQAASADGSSDAEKSFNYFVKEAGFSKAGAAGIVGNLMRETGGDTYNLDPTSAPPDSSYYGIAQWSGSRWNHVKSSYAKGQDSQKLETQWVYIVKEMGESAYKSLIPKLKKATDARQAALDFNRIFEVGADAGQRANNAHKAYEDFKDNAVESTSPSAQPGTTMCCTSGSVGTPSDLDKFLKVLAFQESNGNPDQPGSAGDARGKYQYIDSTWASSASTYYPPAKKYSQAHLAPESVQDAVAYLEYSKKFKDLNNDIFKLAVSHFYPAANENPAKLDVVPDQNVITPRQYAQKLINTMKSSGPWEKIPLKYADAPEFATYAEKVSATASGGSNASCSEDGADNPGSGEIRWPVDKKFYDSDPDLFTSRHHDYPADDIAVPSGTKVYSITSGKVAQATTDSGCGVGVFINYKDNIQIGYCHGTPGSHKVKTGDTVRPGQLIMLSDNTGHSTGPHLHIQIKVDGQLRCPQPIFKNLAQNKDTDLKDLPSGGCSY